VNAKELYVVTHHVTTTPSTTADVKVDASTQDSNFGGLFFTTEAMVERQTAHRATGRAEQGWKPGDCLRRFVKQGEVAALSIWR